MKQRNFYPVRASITIVALLFSFKVDAGFIFNSGYPQAFIQNKGQFDGRSKQKDCTTFFAIDNGPQQVYFTSSGVVFRLDQKKIKTEKDERELEFSGRIKSEKQWARELKEERKVEMKTVLVRMDWVGAGNLSAPKAYDRLDDYFNYGMGPNNIHFDRVAGFRKIVYSNVWPGIDIEYTIHEKEGFKYAFIVHPGANPDLIQLRYSGDAKPTLSKAGDLNLSSAFGDILDHSPFSFTKENPAIEIASGFTLKGNVVGFSIGDYDRSQNLIIDPWTVLPSAPNSSKVWEVETDNAGNVYAYMGDMPFTLRKYNAAGALQWTYLASWDSSGYWVGGIITHPTGDSYFTSGSNGEIRKINSAGSQVWYNNPNSLTSYEYWSLAFNCDLTHLVVGGSRSTFSFPFPVLRGTMMEINLANGTLGTTTIVGYGNLSGIPPEIQEASSICSAPNGNYYFLTLDSVGSINTALNNIQFKVPTSYNFDYYIPGYGLGTKQPISAIRANTAAFYTHNGVTIDKRDLNTGAVIASASIPSGILNTNPLFGTKTQGNGGLDLDNCGNVYVGSGNGVYKFDANLNLLSNATTPGPVYDVDVSINGDVAASGSNFVAVVSLSACAQQTNFCGTALVATVNTVNATCQGSCNGSATVNVTSGIQPYSYQWSNGSSGVSVNGLCAGNYTVTITDAAAVSTTQNFVINQLSAVTVSAGCLTPDQCGQGNGVISATASGGSGNGYVYNWNTSPAQTGSLVTGLQAGNYSVTVTDAQGCTGVTSVSVPLVGGPNVQVSSSTNVTCNGGANGSALVTVNTGTAPFTYTWNTIPAQFSASAINLSAGQYSVTVTDSAGCTANASVNITEPSAITVSGSTSAATCGNANGSATVAASGGTGVLTYSWNTNPAQSGSTLSGLMGGNYAVTVTDGAGCTAQLQLSVGQSSGLQVAVSSIPGCGNQGGSASATAIGGTSPFTYLWTPGGNITGSISGLSSGNYQCLVTDASGCSQSAMVSVVTYPEPVAIAGADATVLSGQSILLSGSGGINYQWTPSSGLSCDTCSSTLAQPIMTTTYCMQVTDQNGCSGSDCLTITVNEPCGDIFVPTAFSPDGSNDPENEKLCVYGSCIKSMEFKIFDRWGSMVFESNSTDNCWDGTYGGKKLNSGIYVWYLKAESKTGELVNLKGDTSLFR